jgi:hypothetical protein
MVVEWTYGVFNQNQRYFTNPAVGFTNSVAFLGFFAPIWGTILIQGVDMMTGEPVIIQGRFRSKE